MTQRYDSKQRADLIITNATILTMDSGHTVIEDGALAVLDGKIAALDKTSNIRNRFTSLHFLDAKGCLVIPGLINAHTHIPMSYFKGLADDLPLDQWLQGFIWPLEKRLVDFGLVYDSTLHGAAELIKNGVTFANDMYFQGDAMAKALIQAGLRCIIGEPVIATEEHGNPSLAEIGAFVVERNLVYKDNPLLSFALAPHSIYACSQAALERVAHIAVEHDLLVHMHLAETDKEASDCHKLHGKLPVHYLSGLGLLKAKLVMAHGIHVEAAEMDILAEHNASIAICTESNLKLGNGFAPIKDYLDKGVNLCFATDGVASNNNLDLLAELDMTAKVHKALAKDPTFLPAEQMLQMATMGAAKALYMDKELGSLEPGKRADLAILDCSTIEAQPLYNPYSQVIYALGGRAVRDVVINGKIVLRDKQLTTLDEKELLDKAKHYKKLILQELKK